MDTAFCTLTLETLDPFSFIASGGLHNRDLRYSLKCPRCGEQAFYRSGFKGRSACFYSAPHGNECKREKPRSRATAVGTRPIGENIERIRVLRNAANRTRAAELSDARGQGIAITPSITQRGRDRGRDVELQLSTVLSRLMLADGLSQSSTLISVAGAQERPAVEFFVKADAITKAHVGSMQGIWGEVASINERSYGIYLNMKGTLFGILIPVDILDAVRARNKLGTDKDIVGASILCTNIIRDEGWTRLTDVDDITIRLS